MKSNQGADQAKWLIGARGLALFFCLIALVVALLPYASAGFYNDDVINSALPGLLRKSGMSVWSGIWETNHAWVVWNGRFFPFAIITGYSIWAVAAGHLASRLVHLTLIAINLAFCAHLLRKLTSSRAIPLLFLAIIPAFFQVRDYHDPMTSYSPLLQEVVLLALLTLAFFLKFLSTGRRAPYFLSLFFYAAVLATYELGVVAIFLVFGAVLFRCGRKGWSGLVGLTGHILVSLIFFGINFYLKAHAIGGYTGTQVRIGSQSGTAFIKQLLATIPLDYFYVDPQKLLHPFPWPTAEGWALAILLLVASFAAILLALSLTSEKCPSNLGFTFFIGATLFVLPACIIAQSAKYQDELLWGWGYLPVYMQFFGLAIILTTICSYLSVLARRKLGRRVQLACALLLAFPISAIGSTSFLVNRYMVEYRNSTLRYPREFIASAAEHGLFKNVPAGSIILRDALNPWDFDAFYTMHARRSVKVFTPQEWLADQPDGFYATHATTTPVFELKYQAEPRSGGTGWALLARVQEVSYRKEGKRVRLLSRTVLSPSAYLREDKTAPDSIWPAIAEGWLITGGPILSPRRTDLAALPSKRAGAHGRNVRLPAGRYRNLEVDHTGTVALPDKEIFLLRQIDAPNDPVSVVDTFNPAAVQQTEDIVGVGRGENLVDERTISFVASRGSSVELKAKDLAHGLGLAFLVRPRNEQMSYAVLASNHSNDVRGFALEQDGGPDPSRYICVIGNGATWESLGSVSLPADRWSLVILGIDRTGTRLEVIGPEGSVVRELPTLPLLSETDQGVFRLGNWIGGDRGFNGQISSVMVAPEPLNAQQRATMTANYDKRRSSGAP